MTYHLIAYSFSNISAKNCQNWLTRIEAIVPDIGVIFGTVYLLWMSVDIWLNLWVDGTSVT